MTKRVLKTLLTTHLKKWRYPLFVIATIVLVVLSAPKHSHAFDYYVLSLSWSPTFCRDRGGAHSAPEQCHRDADFGLIVHGLWPQNENDYPEFCQTDDSVSQDVADIIRPAMPSDGLIRHQWKKHGSCSGLSPREYFEATRKAAGLLKYPRYLLDPSEPKITSPKEVINDIYTLNPTLPDGAIKLTCRNQRLKEIRLCLTKNLTPRKCGARAGFNCSSRRLVLPQSP